MNGAGGDDVDPSKLFEKEKGRTDQKQTKVKGTTEEVFGIKFCMAQHQKNE